MNMNQTDEALVARQAREVEYHRERAKKLSRELLETPFSYDVIHQNKRRWWNGYWEMYHFISSLNLQNSKVLVVGCGFGQDALRIAKLGAKVSAFDISLESLDIARKIANRECLEIDFMDMSAENMIYQSNSFDYVIAVDILHHVDIPKTMQEIERVSKDGALFVFNEIYSHSVTEKIRRSKFVEKFLYPKMQGFIYKGQDPYITEDEKKLNEIDVKNILAIMTCVEFDKILQFHRYSIVTRQV